MLLVDLGVVPADAQVAAVVVPAQDPEPPPGKGEEFGKASPIALVVIILLGISTVVLIVSMTRRLKKLPKSFDEEEPTSESSVSSTDEDTSSETRKD
ncbi:MAG: hypothetical protein J0I34_29695 [Pseudonocardia sp.]|uniref:hypothetical protein n=1 Tax=unclassified Pseudonocardia TaxID=2619320 RepID=UPI000ACA8382|nr:MULTISPECIES: hypothetical protein [unclassified Pseudonocardia]MBN9112947.1 hypothetical protein [Pseudonocardia sp.]